MKISLIILQSTFKCKYYLDMDTKALRFIAYISRPNCVCVGWGG